MRGGREGIVVGILIHAEGAGSAAHVRQGRASGMATVKVRFGRYREEEDDIFTENPLASFPSFSDFKTSRVLVN